MAVLQVKSKKHGNFDVLLDDDDFDRIGKLGRTNKWCVRACKNRHGLYYFQKRLSDQKLIELHRFIVNAPKGMVVDHINGDTLDNRKDNLRICSNGSNIRKGKIRTNNKSGYPGVSKALDQRVNPYVATIKVNYKIINLGSYKTFKAAVEARQEAERKYYNI